MRHLLILMSHHQRNLGIISSISLINLGDKIWIIIIKTLLNKRKKQGF